MLETKIHELTLAVEALTKAIGGMQAPGQTVQQAYVGQYAHEALIPQAQWTTEQAAATATRQQAEQPPPNEQSKSTPDTSQTSAEESKPALTYVNHVKPVTLRLSKEKGRETAIAVLGRFGVKGAQDLDASQWTEYIAHCEKMLAGGEA